MVDNDTAVAATSRLDTSLYEGEKRFHLISAHLTHVLESSPDAVCSFDSDGRFVQVSAACEKIWGYSPTEMIGKPYMDMVFPDDRERTRQASADIRAGKITSGFENRYLRKDGSIVHILWTAWWSEADKGMFCVARDNTEANLGREALLREKDEVRKLNAELEQRVMTRTAELGAANDALVKEIAERKQTEIDLINARRAAEEANRAKSAFLANMSHEIRTPMNGIIGMNYLVKQTRLTLKQSDYVSKIDVAAHNLLGIINDILDFSKVESGKIELEHIEFNLDDVLSKLDQVASMQALQKALEFKISVAYDTPTMLIGDPLRLGQILLNLTSNAIKFTAKGKVEVSVALLERDDAHIALQFKVQDTGIGFDPQSADNLFEPFSQSDTSTARCFGGTGLGLAISKRLLQLMGGKFDIQSKPGFGSTFSFTARLEKAARGGQSSSSRKGILSDQRALLITSEAECRMETEKLLTQLSIKASFALSCEAASSEIMRLSKAGEQGFDLILLDCTSGTHCAEDGKRLQLECAVAGMPPIILIVTQDVADLQYQKNDAEFGGFLIKPIKRSSLFDMVVRVLSRRYGLKRHSSKIKIYPALRGARIMLVEDNEINQEIAAEILKMMECEVVVASNGADAHALLEAAPVDTRFSAVLMDIQMPGLDGYASTQLIRASKRYAEVPILAMTADAMSGVKEKCLAAGMNDYLTKPIDPDELCGKLAKWIQA